MQTKKMVSIFSGNTGLNWVNSYVCGKVLRKKRLVYTNKNMCKERRGTEIKITVWIRMTQRYSGVFREYKMKILARNGLIFFPTPYIHFYPKLWRVIIKVRTQNLYFHINMFKRFGVNYKQNKFSQLHSNQSSFEIWTKQIWNTL